MFDALTLLGGLVCESDRSWAGESANFQHDDAAAICSDVGPRRHYVTRPRGASKTSDIAAISLALLISEAPKRSRSYVYAVDTDQALEVHDALIGFVSRTPGLAGAVEIGTKSLKVKATGASLNIESSDAASAWSKRPWLVIIDEFTSWPDLPSYRRLWTAIASSLPKRPDSRLVILSMAGSPLHPAAKVWELAQSSPDWRASSTPGPCPWWSEADIESTRILLTPAEFRRYVGCEWIATDEALSSAEDVAACTRPAPAVLPPRDHVRYVAALDVGVRKDLTGLVVAHCENRAAGRVVVVDRVVSWKPSRGERVDLAEVEETVFRICRGYKATLVFDRSQAEQLTQGLARRGVRVDEFVFSTAGANRLAKSVYTSLRDRSVEIPDDAELASELQTTRMAETTVPGMLKLVNPVGHHDDLVVCLGMTIVSLTEYLDGLPAVMAGPEMARRKIVPQRITDKALIRDAPRSGWGRASVGVGVAVESDDEAQRWAAIRTLRRGARV